MYFLSNRVRIFALPKKDWRKELFYLEENEKILMFEKMPIPRAIAKLAVPTILSSLVMVIYNMADTYFVGMLNDPVQNAAVTLHYPLSLIHMSILQIL